MFLKSLNLKTHWFPYECSCPTAQTTQKVRTRPMIPLKKNATRRHLLVTVVTLWSTEKFDVIDRRPAWFGTSSSPELERQQLAVRPAFPEGRTFDCLSQNVCSASPHFPFWFVEYLERRLTTLNGITVWHQTVVFDCFELFGWHRLLDMATVTRVKDGTWLVNFPEFQLDMFKIHQMDFRFNQKNYSLLFSVNETEALAKLYEGKIIFYYYYIFQTKFVHPSTFRLSKILVFWMWCIGNRHKRIKWPKLFTTNDICHL